MEQNNKKRTKRITMVVGIASLVAAFVIIGAVFVLSSVSGCSDSASEPSALSDTNTSNQAGSSLDSQDGNSNDAEGDASSQNGPGASSDTSSEDADSVQGSSADQSSASGISGGNSVKTNQLPDSSFLYDTDIAELVSADTFNDGQRVQIKGEVVGDAIADESSNDHYWITVQDTDVANPSSIEVLIPKDALSVIDSFGSYGQQGSIVQVRGTYQLACADHQGLSDIHADEVQVLSAGQEQEERVSSVVFTSAVIAVCLGCALLILYHVKRERTR